MRIGADREQEQGSGWKSRLPAWWPCGCQTWLTQGQGAFAGAPGSPKGPLGKGEEQRRDLEEHTGGCQAPYQHWGGARIRGLAPSHSLDLWAILSQAWGYPLGGCGAHSTEPGHRLHLGPAVPLHTGPGKPQGEWARRSWRVSWLGHTQSALCSGSCLGPAAPGCAPVVRAPGLPATCAGHSWASAHTHRLPRRAPASQQHMQRGTGTPRGAGGRWVEQAGRGGTGPSPGGTGPHRGADPTRLSMPTSSSAVGALCSATSPGPAAPGLDPARGPSRAGRS